MKNPESRARARKLQIPYFHPLASVLTGPAAFLNAILSSAALFGRGASKGLLVSW